MALDQALDQASGSIRLTTTRLSPATRRSLLRGLTAYRWLTITWASGAFGWEVWHRQGSAEPVAQPEVGFLLLGLAVTFTAYLTILFGRRPDQLLRPVAVLAEIGLGTVMLGTDAWVFGGADHAQTVPSVWVVAAVATVAIAGGRRAAVTTGLGMGLARYVGILPFTESFSSSLTGLASMVLLGVAGWVMGYLLRRLREAERSISAYRAREEVARTLHDGVLQTLAVIQRRSHDQELVALARTQEAELRDYLFGAPDPEPGGPGSGTGADLAAGLRAAARRAEERYGIRLTVVVSPDLPSCPPESSQRLSAAVGEALTNAVKHGQATTATVYAEPAEPGDHEAKGPSGGEATVFVSVKDDGDGFDSGQVAEGEGIRRSIRGRLAEIGGTVEIDGRPGRGTEVRMWV